MNKTVEHIISILSRYRLSFQNEKELQAHIEKLFLSNNISFKREYNLGEKGIIDFYIDGLGIEIKTKGQKKSIYRQCRTYTEHNEIKSLLLISSNAVFLPDTLNDKPIFTYRLE